MVTQERNPAFYWSKRTLSFIFCLFVGLGCSEPKIQPIDQRSLLQKDTVLGKKIAENIDSKFDFVGDPNLSDYLSQVGQRLLKSTAYLHEIPLKVRVFSNVRSSSLQERARNYSLPGNQVYLSLVLIKKVSNEAELAALLAVELGHLENRHLLKKLFAAQKTGASSENQSFLRSTGWKDVVESLPHLKQEEEAVQDAVQILYHSGYDTRAIVSYYQYFKSLGERSPFKKKEVDHIINVARREIAANAPLLNPTVKTEEFSKFKKRIRSL